MATVGQVYYNVIDHDSGGILAPMTGINIFQNIVSAYGANQFTKLGIQAPPGTRVVLNDNKTIVLDYEYFDKNIDEVNPSSDYDDLIEIIKRRYIVRK